MSLSRSPTTISCAALPRRSQAAAVASIQRMDSLSSIARARRAFARLLGRVQICACTAPSNASSSASTATIAWQKNPGVFPSPAGPSPRRLRCRPLKLISVVSCAATIRLPAQAAAVRPPAVLRISLGVTRGQARKRCADISPARSPPTLRTTKDPVVTTRSNKAAPASCRRTSPKKTDPEPGITIHHRLLAFAQAVVNHSARRPAITKFFSPGFLTTGAKSADHPNQTRECRSRLRGEVGLRASLARNPGEGDSPRPEYLESPPHPDPLPASGEREKRPPNSAPESTTS